MKGENSTKPQPVPGPSGYPIFGNMFQLQSGRLHHQCQEWNQEYGPIFRISMLGKKIVILNSSKVISKAFANTGSTALDYRAKTFVGLHCLTNGIAASADLEFSLKQKEVLVKVLKDHSLLGDGVHRKMTEKCRQQTSLLTSKDNVDPYADLLRPTMQFIITETLIGEPLKPDDPDGDVLWEFIEHILELIEPSVDSALRMFPFLRHLPGYYGNLYRQTIAARDRISKRFFDDQKASYRPGTVRGLVDVCLMTQQEEIARTGNSWLTDDYIRGLIYDTLIAGMTELLNTMRLFTLLMCHHPDVQTKLQAEIDSVVGSDRFPAASDQKWLPYTMAVILETWRYGSQIQLGIPHVCNKDINLEGYLIEAGTVLLPNIHGVHHDEALWGDPWDFRPTRFLDESGTLLPADHAYMQNVIPFSLGKRSCPGQDFARTHIFICVTSLMQRVSVSPPENSKLPSADPRLYTRKYPLTEPSFKCRVVTRENGVI